MKFVLILVLFSLGGCVTGAIESEPIGEARGRWWTDTFTESAEDVLLKAGWQCFTTVDDLPPVNVYADAVEDAEAKAIGYWWAQFEQWVDPENVTCFFGLKNPVGQMPTPAKTVKWSCFEEDFVSPKTYHRLTVYVEKGAEPEPDYSQKHYETYGVYAGHDGLYVTCEPKGIFFDP